MKSSYPNEADLKFIEEYYLVASGPHDLIAHILALWHLPEDAQYNKNGVL